MVSRVGEKGQSVGRQEEGYVRRYEGYEADDVGLCQLQPSGLPFSCV